VELTYIQLLDYENGKADIILKNNISLFQTIPVLEQSLQVDITSDREIMELQLLSHTPDVNQNNVHSANLHYLSQNQFAGTDYHLQYSMDYEHPGTQYMSTFRDSVPDNGGRGFFAFFAEPDPTEANASMRKIYSIVIDCSGSMEGENKLVQAQQASDYIVDHLNPGDYFNIIGFNTQINSLWNEPRPINAENAELAHTFINSLVPINNTNMSLVFTNAINQFGVSADSIANIIIFMTDGMPTEGITDPADLSAYVDNLVVQTETDIFLFSFGIGDNVNEDLLNMLSENNQGTAIFVGADEIYSAVTNFYYSACNPLLVNPHFGFIEPDALNEVYPITMTNLYLGRQNLICGRYSTPQTVQFIFSGFSFNQAIAYNYQIELSGTDLTEYDFLPQLWARNKIESLLMQYYACTPDTPEANALWQQITQMSSMFKVQAIYEGTGMMDAQDEHNQTPAYEIKLLGNYPNPFSPSTAISFKTGHALANPVELRIYNCKGQLVRILARFAKTTGTYELVWDGKNKQGKQMAEGIYFYTLSHGNTVNAGKMTLLN
jgi:Ca-activated chloride channel family protein